jgi:hypothetical protein
MVGGQVVAGHGAFAGTVPPQREALNGLARVLSPRGATGHAMPAQAPGAPHGHGDGHRH